MDRWTNFYLATTAAAGTLLGLVFVAVSLQPKALAGDFLIRLRARASFYLLATAFGVSLAEVAGLNRLGIGLVQVAIAAVILVRATQVLTVEAARHGELRGRVLLRSIVSAMCWLLIIAVGIAAAAGVSRDITAALLALGVAQLLTFGIINAWTLVLLYAERLHD
jgi:hypothetical protein